MAAYTERLVKRFGTGDCRSLSREEMTAFSERMLAATEEQRRRDRKARAMSELYARFKWLG